MNLLKVLIVDDEYLIRSLIRMRIDWEENGMEIVGEAGCPDEAMRMVEDLKPNIIFTDICMPKMDGIDFASHVLERYPDIRIAVITGHDDFSYMQRSIRAGIVDYLMKPIQADELLTASRRMCESIKKERELASGLVNQRISKQLNPLVSRVLAYLDDHLADEKLNINNVAELFFVSRGHLSRLIKQETGKTFVEQLTELRIQKAKRMLLDTDLPAYMIGEKVGIKDPHYFSILFKKIEGIPLNRYRKGSESTQ